MTDRTIPALARQRIAAYIAAYEAANGSTPVITYARGFYYVGKPPLHTAYRGARVDEMIARLEERAKEKADAPVEVVREPAEFWWVWTKHGRFPRKFHNSGVAAEVEAARLARKHPGRKFIVLQATVKLSVPEKSE